MTVFFSGGGARRGGNTRASFQDECDRQLVGVERITKIGKGYRQQLNLIEELVQRESRSAP